MFMTITSYARYFLFKLLQAQTGLFTNVPLIQRANAIWKGGGFGSGIIAILVLQLELLSDQIAFVQEHPKEF